MSWRVTVQYVCADGTTTTKSRDVPTRPTTQHLADRRGYITAPGLIWHLCGVNEILLERIPGEVPHD